MKLQATTKEDILIEALPYIQRYEGKTFVIKYGGAAMTDEYLQDSFAKDVMLLRKIGINIVIVHGGGKEITELSTQLGHKTRFVNGQRYTDENTLKTVMMSLVGTVNKDVVQLISRAGGSAIGLSGVDNSLIRAKKLSMGIDLGLVGEVESVNTEFLTLLLKSDSIPVIAPVGVGEMGEVYNINADLAAGGIAAALGAEKLFFLTDTEGILIKDELIPTLTKSRAQEYIERGSISGGMIPKVTSGFNALENGVKKVHIIDGRAKHSILLEVFTNEGVGTQIIQDESLEAELGVDGSFASERIHSFIPPAPKQKAKRYKDHAEHVRLKKDLLDFSSLRRSDLEYLFELADTLKEHPEYQPLKGKTAALLFQKPSLRTRVSFEVGIAQLGGTSYFLGHESIGLGERESVHDTATVISRYNDMIIARLFKHEVAVEMAKSASIPVINALTDLSHPCQILADLYTLREHGKLKPRVKIAFIGDGNNVANSWIEAAGIYPMHFVLACPKGFGPDPDILAKAQATGVSCIEIVDDPQMAADDADVLYTDVWTSMGQESEQIERKKQFAKFQINRKLLQLAKPDAVVMHCLPAHDGEEITNEVMHGEQSIVFDQAENRLHIQKAVMVTLLASHLEKKPELEQHEVQVFTA